MLITSTSSSNASKLFYIIFLVDIIMNLIPTWRGSFVTRFMDLEVWGSFVISLSNYLNIMMFCIMLMISRTKNNCQTSSIVFMSFFMLFSVLINFKTHMLIRAIGFPFVMLGLFCSSGLQLDRKVLRLASFFIIIWCILPVAYIPFASDEHLLYLFTTDNEKTVNTFCGFGTHRNYYGFYAAFSLLLLTMEDFSKVFKFISYPLLVIGLFLASSRTALLGAFFVIFFFKWKTVKLRYLILIGSFVAIELLFYFAENIDSRIIGTGNSDRFELYYLFVDLILSNPLFGQGDTALAFSTNYVEGSPCHNFILQTAADYGVPALIVFCLFLYRTYTASRLEAKMVVLLVVITGLFQPYLALRFPSQFMLIAFLFIVFYNNVVYDGNEARYK